MYFENHLYGHAEILSAYAFRPDSSEASASAAQPILGFLQHGWSPISQYFAHRQRAWSSHFPRLVWSTIAENVSREAGESNISAIGAPFCYLHSIKGGQASSLDIGEGYTLFVPFHEPKPFRQSHASLAQEVSERYASKRVVALLFIKEFAEQKIVEAYHDVGIDVACNGFRNDPEFLYRMYDLLIGAEEVVTNAVASALWYGLYLKRPTSLLEGFSNPPSLSWYSSEADLVQRWPFLARRGTGAVEEAYSEACVQLGADRVLSPIDLKEVLGWQGVLRPAAARLLRAIYDRRAPMPKHGTKDVLPPLDPTVLYLPAR